MNTLTYLQIMRLKIKICNSVIATIVLTTLILCNANAQTKPQPAENNWAYYHELAESNLKYLSNDWKITNRVEVNSKGIIVYDNHTKSRQVMNLYWSDVVKFVDIVENWNYYEMVRAFSMKGNQAFVQPPTGMVHWYKSNPTSFEDLRIAIDPGHYGGGSEESHYEMRFAKFRKEDVPGAKGDIEYYEADLAWGIAAILRDSIEAHNGRVLLTRSFGFSAFDKKFKDWYKTDFKKDLDKSLQNGDVTKDLYKELLDTVNHALFAERFVFEKYFKFLDFRKRVEKINDFRPAMTFAIHLNAQEGNKRFGERYLQPVNDNYNMCFVAGGFMAGELEKVDQKVDFFRLLLSKDIDNSVRVGKKLMANHEKYLNVPTIPINNNLNVLRDNSIPIEEGVYARNLAITRMIRGVVVYGESLIQDNIEEIPKLSDKSVKYMVPGYGEIRLPKRCVEIANAYFQTIKETLEENKKVQTTEGGEVLR